MAGSVSIWKIFGFPKVSLYLERFVLKHATAHIQTRWASLEKEPAAQIAHLVFCQRTGKPKKNQKSYFLPTLNIGLKK
jgi:hypothetical protein